MSIMHTALVGARHHIGANARILQLEEGEKLVLMREPSNPYDKNAVSVYAADGQKLGYVPRQDAPAVAKAMDSGLEVAAVVRLKRTSALTISWKS